MTRIQIGQHDFRLVFEAWPFPWPARETLPSEKLGWEWAGSPHHFKDLVLQKLRLLVPRPKEYIKGRSGRFALVAGENMESLRRPAIKVGAGEPEAKYILVFRKNPSTSSPTQNSYRSAQKQCKTARSRINKPMLLLGVVVPPKVL